MTKNSKYFVELEDYFDDAQNTYLVSKHTSKNLMDILRKGN
jgi:hypothetical protein